MWYEVGSGKCLTQNKLRLLKASLINFWGKTMGGNYNIRAKSELEWYDLYDMFWDEIKLLVSDF